MVNAPTLQTSAEWLNSYERSPFGKTESTQSKDTYFKGSATDSPGRKRTGNRVLSKVIKEQYSSMKPVDRATKKKNNGALERRLQRRHISAGSNEVESVTETSQSDNSQATQSTSRSTMCSTLSASRSSNALEDEASLRSSSSRTRMVVRDPFRPGQESRRSIKDIQRSHSVNELPDDRTISSSNAAWPSVSQRSSRGPSHSRHDRRLATNSDDRTASSNAPWPSQRSPRGLSHSRLGRPLPTNTMKPFGSSSSVLDVSPNTEKFPGQQNVNRRRSHSRLRNASAIPSVGRSYDTGLVLSSSARVLDGDCGDNKVENEAEREEVYLDLDEFEQSKARSDNASSINGGHNTRSGRDELSASEHATLASRRPRNEGLSSSEQGSSSRRPRKDGISSRRPRKDGLSSSEQNISSSRSRPRLARRNSGAGVEPKGNRQRQNSGRIDTKSRSRNAAAHEPSVGKPRNAGGLVRSSSAPGLHESDDHWVAFDDEAEGFCLELDEFEQSKMPSGDDSRKNNREKARRGRDELSSSEHATLSSRRQRKENNNTSSEPTSSSRPSRKKNTPSPSERSLPMSTRSRGSARLRRRSGYQQQGLRRAGSCPSLDEVVKQEYSAMAATQLDDCCMSTASLDGMLLHHEREERSLQPLTRSEYLDAAAFANAQLVAQSNGQQPMVKSYPGHVARGRSIASIHEKMMEDPCSERANILNSRFTQYGMSTCKGSDGLVYLCQLFRD